MVRKSNFNNTRMLGLAALAATMTCGTTLSALALPTYRAVTLDAGSVIPVKLDNELTSNNTRKGDTFTVTLRNNTDAEFYHLPTGTRIEGIVQEARAKKDNNPGVLDLSFRTLRLPNGRSYPIEGSLIGLDNKSVEKRDDGRLVAKPGHTNDRLTYVGYGAGAGLLVGLLTKHGLEDTVIGGGLGYLFGSLQKGGSKQTRDVDLKVGSELGVRLDHSVTLADYGSQDDYNNYRSRNDDSGKFHRGNDDNSGNKGSRNNGSNPAKNSGGSYRYNQDDTAGRANRNNSNRDNRNDNAEDRRISQDRINATDIGVLVGDRNVSFASTARPFQSKGVLMVPVRPVLDATHIPFSFNNANQEIRATGDGGTVRLAVGSSIAVINGNRRVRLDAPAQRMNGTTYVPVKFFGLVTGQDATYDAGSRTVLINTNNTANDQNN
jgi:hypothetical protein